MKFFGRNPYENCVLCGSLELKRKMKTRRIDGIFELLCQSCANRLDSKLKGVETRYGKQEQ